MTNGTIENEVGVTLEEVASNVRKNWGWLMFAGIALVLLGCAGLYMSGVMTLVSVLYLGFIVIAGGVFLLVDGFQAVGWKAKVWEILLAVMYIICGIAMVVHPAASAVWFTLFIAAFLLVSGIFRIVIGFQVRKEAKGWGLTVLSGIASLVLAFMIYAEWPISGLWVIGMFVSIEMLMQGTSMVAIAAEARAAHKALD